MVKKILAKTYIWLILIFMYLPILVLVAYSFIDSKIIGVGGPFTWDLYVKLFQDQALMIALRNTVIIALSSAIISTILGASGAIGVHYLNKKLKKAFNFSTQIPIANAEIVIAVSLALLFITLFGKGTLGWATLIVGHVVLSLPFVFISVKPKLEQMDPSLYEAALDLGCTPSKAIGKVLVPEIMPGVLSGFLLAITLSLDDYIVTSFTSGMSVTTLSTFIQDKLAKGSYPNDLRALTSIIFLAVVLVVIVLTIVRSRKKDGLSKSHRLYKNYKGAK